MKKHLLLVAAIAVIILSAGFSGCSVGTPGSPDPPPMPTQGDTDSMSGGWIGTWTSYSGSGDYGSIDPLEFEETETPDPEDDGYILDGKATISGMEGISQGNIQGTRNGNNVKFSITFPEGPVMSFSGSLSYGSITGSYTLDQDDEQLDSGSFFISKNP